jgi:hypothetical protein
LDAKICKRCGIEKDIAEFRSFKRAIKSEPGVTRNYLANVCKPCNRLSNNDNYGKTHKDKRKLTYRDKYLIYTYGITEDEYNEILLNQGNGCAICGSTVSLHKQTQRLSVDHDHITNEVRGILCHACNTGLGYFRDNTELLQSAIRYLESAKS